MRQSVIVAACRTPFGTFGGGLKDLPAPELGAIVIKELLQRTGLKGEQIDNVILGEVLQAGVGQIPSRQATLKAGLPFETPSETINKVCASGLRAVTMADAQIRAGDGSIMIAGGMESMSNAPFAMKKARWGYRMGNDVLIDLMVNDGLWCAYHNVHMAVHGGTVAKEYGVSREEQDAFALRSQMRASAAIKDGKFKDEIVAVRVPGRKGEVKIIDTDEGPRSDSTLEKLAALPPIFTKDNTVTAGNAPGVNDGAGALVVMDKEVATALGYKPLATIMGHSMVAAEPAYIATVPGLATNKLLAKKGMTVKDVDLFEANEAFAAVALVSGKITSWDPEKVNVNGGAVAFGHPIGASGARIVMTAIYEMKRRGGGIAVCAICSGAAQGDAIMLQVEA